MLKVLRTKTRKVMLVTLILVIPSFVFYFGWQSISGKKDDSTGPLARFSPAPAARAEIRGWGKWVDVSREDLVMTRRKMRNNLRNIFGTSIDEVLEREVSEEDLMPTKDVIRETVNDWYLSYFADLQKISVSDAELTALIDGYFKDYPLLEQREALLANQGLSVSEFENRLRLSERFKRSRQFFAVEARPSLAELWETFRTQKQRMRLDYFFFNAADLASTEEIPDDALETYYRQNGEKFRVGDQRLYRYAFLDKQDVVKDVLPATPEEIRAYYEEKKTAKYRHGRQVKVRHILIGDKTTPKMTTEEKAKATSETLTTAQLIYQKAMNGEDFAKLADTFSDDPMNTSPTLKGAPVKRGGLRQEWISEDVAWRYGRDFTQTALSLETGKISPPVSATVAGAKGFSVIKCEEAREAGVLPFDEVQFQVPMDCRKDKTDKVFSDKSRDLKAKIRNYSTLDTLAKDLGMKDGKTSWVLTTSLSLSKEVYGLEASDLEYINTSLRKGEMSPLLRTPNLLYVLYVEDEKPTHIPADFREVRGAVTAAYRAEKSRETAKAEAEKFLASVKAADLASTESAKLSVPLKTTPFFTRVDLPKDLPAPLIDFAKDSTGITTGTLGISPAGENDKKPTAYVVWHARAVQDPSPKAFEEALPALERNDALVKSEGLVNEWLRDLRSMTKIEENKNLTE